MRLRRIAIVLATVMVLVVVLAPAIAFAQSNADGSPLNADPALGASANSYGLLDPGFGLDGAVGQIVGWIPRLQSMALKFFVIVAILEFVWLMIVCFIQNRPAGELLGAFVPKMLGFALFYWILVQNGFQISQTIIWSFLHAMQASGGPTPGSITGTSLMDHGWTIASPMIAYSILLGLVPNYFNGILASIGFTNMLTPLMMIQLFGATMVIGSFTALAGVLALTTFEAYLVSVIGMIMSGWSALRITHQTAGNKMLAFAISVGVKLMVIYFCIGLINAAIVPLITTYAVLPFLGALLAAFVSIATFLIAYNMAAFASGIVSGTASAMAGAAVSATMSYVNQAQAMARGMSELSGGMHDMQRVKALDQQHGQQQHVAAQNVQGSGTEAPPAHVPTVLSSDQQPSANGPATAPQQEFVAAVHQAPTQPAAGNVASSGVSHGATVSNGSGGNGASTTAAAEPARPSAAGDADPMAGRLHDLGALYDKRAATNDPAEQKNLDGEIEKMRDAMLHDIHKRMGEGAWMAENGLLNAGRMAPADNGVPAAQIRTSV